MGHFNVMCFTLSNAIRLGTHDDECCTLTLIHTLVGARRELE
jgi:hypothetical protein